LDTAALTSQCGRGRCTSQRCNEHRNAARGSYDPTLISSIVTRPWLAASSTARASDRRVGRELDRRRAGEARGIAAAARIRPPSSRTEPTLSASVERDLDQLLDLGLARTCRIGAVDRSALVAIESRSDEVTATDPACS